MTSLGHSCPMTSEDRAPSLGNTKNCRKISSCQATQIFVSYYLAASQDQETLPKNGDELHKYLDITGKLRAMCGEDLGWVDYSLLCIPTKPPGFGQPFKLGTALNLI